MILFLDTSALIKLYVEEAGGDGVLQSIQRADLLAVSELTLIETHSALARLEREHKISRSACTALRRDVNAEFKAFYFQVRVSARLKQTACRLLVNHALRAMDAMQLASALIIKRNRRRRVVFASFDVKLNLAAMQAGMEILQSPVPKK